MIVKKTIIINAAGCGSRLGQQVPKSLVSVAGKPILEWQLTQQCRPHDRVRLVVGFKGEQVEALAKQIFPSIEVLFNDQWKETKTAASLSLGASGLDGRCLSLDGDLLVHPSDFREILSADQNIIGVTDVKTSHPVYANVNEQGLCHLLCYDAKTQFEWTGLVNFIASEVPPCNDNVYQMISGILPISTRCVRCVEVDTPEDLEQANRLWPSFLEN